MELFRALAVLAEPPTANAVRLTETLDLPTVPDVSEHTDLFDFQLYPYASVYLGNEGMLGGEAHDRIAGFWRVLGLTPPTEADHLSVMLALYAQLAESDENENDALQRTRWRTARKAFLWEHLLSWLPVYIAKLNDIAPPFYQRWGDILQTALFGEALALGTQEEVSLHLRESAGLIDPREGDVDEFLQSLLSPVRSGMILVRSDLTRAANRLGLGTRIGERKFVLKALFGQDASAVLDWLGEEAAEWTRRHRLWSDALGETATIWENKATATETLMGELAKFGVR
jgi:hypothetical protein